MQEVLLKLKDVGRGGEKEEGDATMCSHTYFFKKDLFHLPNGFYGLFLIS